MQAAWIDLECPNCGELWEAEIDDLPGSDAEYTCPHCGKGRPMAGFAHTERDLEVLEAFHAG